MEEKRPLHVDKDKLRVIIFTQHYKIVGDIFLPKSGRLSDFLNKTVSGVKTEFFIPVTNAECFSMNDGQLKYLAEFVAVNKDHIHLIFPYNNK